MTTSVGSSGGGAPVHSTDKLAASRINGILRTEGGADLSVTPADIQQITVDEGTPPTSSAAGVMGMDAESENDVTANIISNRAIEENSRTVVGSKLNTHRTKERNYISHRIQHRTAVGTSSSHIRQRKTVCQKTYESNWTKPFWLCVGAVTASLAFAILGGSLIKAGKLDVNIFDWKIDPNTGLYIALGAGFGLAAKIAILVIHRCTARPESENIETDDLGDYFSQSIEDVDDRSTSARRRHRNTRTVGVYEPEDSNNNVDGDPDLQQAITNSKKIQHRDDWDKDATSSEDSSYDTEEEDIRKYDPTKDGKGKQKAGQSTGSTSNIASSVTAGDTTTSSSKKKKSKEKGNDDLIRTRNKKEVASVGGGGSSTTYIQFSDADASVGGGGSSTTYIQLSDADASGDEGDGKKGSEQSDTSSNDYM